MTQDITDLERDIEESRARLDLTIDRLQDKLSVSGVVDDLLGSMRANAYRSVFDQALVTIRRNPVPVMLIAAGLGILLYRTGREAARSRPAMPRPYNEAPVPVLTPAEARVYEPGTSPPLHPAHHDPMPHEPMHDAIDGRRDLSPRATAPLSSKEFSHG